MNGVSRCWALFDASELSREDRDVFSFGSRISAHLGYKDDTDEVFDGEITGQRVLLDREGPALYEAAGMGLLQRLGHAAGFRRFERKTPSEATGDILSGRGLEGEVERFGAKADCREGGEKKDLELVLEKRYGKASALAQR
jgi:hypothetical protein